jgi:hypothetical protein
MDLITNTVKPQSWDDVGGPGTISPFNNGVYVDASGELKRALRPEAARGLAVERLASLVAKENKNPKQVSSSARFHCCGSKSTCSLPWRPGGDRTTR